MAANPQPAPESPQRDSEVPDITLAAADLAAAWQSYRQSEVPRSATHGPTKKRAFQLGLKFGQVCCGVRNQFKGKAPGWLAVLKQSGIRMRTAYAWMLNYERSISVKEDHREPDPKTARAAARSVATAWNNYQDSNAPQRQPGSEKYELGLKFGRVCCEVRDKFKRKATCFFAVLKQSGIRIGRTTIYRWMTNYEMSAGMKEDHRRQKFLHSDPEAAREAARSLAIAWKNYQDSERDEKYERALTFGQVCSGVRGRFKHKGWLAILEQSGIRVSSTTVYWWIKNYEARQQLLAEQVIKPKKPRGRQPGSGKKTQLFIDAAKLYDRLKATNPAIASYGTVAKRLTPQDYEKDPNRAADLLRLGADYVREKFPIIVLGS